MYIAIFCFIFSDYSEPRGDNGYLALKILTARATLEKWRELRRLKAVKRLRNFTGLPNLHDHFCETSHHGNHLCFGLSVLGPSIEDLRQSLPTKTLPVHVVQRVVGSILEALERLHHNQIIHCGMYLCLPPRNYLYYWQKLTHTLLLFNIAVIHDNICTFVFQTKDDLDPVLATLPPCTIERKVTVDGVEYPIVRSQPIPHDLDLEDTHVDNDFYLNNFGYCTSWLSFRS